MNESRYYFAYGSNLNCSQMQNRCPQAFRVGRARLDGYQFMINRQHYATVIAQPEHVVWGGLWLLAPSDEESLDRYEGVIGGFYTKAEVAVIAMSEITKALTYFAADSDPGYPNADYLKNILIGAKEFGLPDYYLNDLAAHARRAA